MFSKQPEVKEVKSEAQLVAELNEHIKSFVNAYLDAGLCLQSGSLYDSAVPKPIVNGIIALIGAEMIKREAKRQHAGEVEFVPPKWNPFKNRETRVDNRTPQQRAADLRKKQIEDNTAEFVPG